MAKFNNDADIKKLEGYWSNLEDLKRELRYREWELLNPHQETDSNIGGGKANRVSDTTGNRAVLLADDRTYQNLKNIISTIEGLYPELDDDQKVIVQMRYWDKKECYEWQHIADKLYMSVQRVLRKRNNIIDETAKRMGWI
jgi:RinA family phage transcriptional activator